MKIVLLALLFASTGAHAGLLSLHAGFDDLAPVLDHPEPTELSGLPGNATEGMPIDPTSFDARPGVAHQSGRIALQYTAGPKDDAGYIGVDSAFTPSPFCASGTDEHSPNTALSPPTTCPEPASMALVTTALAMVVAFGVPRRRARFAG